MRISRSSKIELGSPNELPKIQVSDVKRLGWRSLMRRLAADGPLLITNHRIPEVVLLAVEDYKVIAASVQRASGRRGPSLDDLTEGFKKRLELLEAPVGDRALRTLLDDPPILNANVSSKAGTRE